MQLFDSHCHINDRRLCDRIPEVIQRARDVGVVGMIAVGTTAETSLECRDLANTYPSVYAAVGIQPNCVHEARAEDWQRVVSLVNDSRVVALGETGLDRYWKDAPFEQQQDYFDRHLRLSQERDVPFIVHMRDCGADVLAMLAEARRRGPLRGVMHSFTGDLDLMQACVELGLYISFAGMVTFKNSDELRNVAAAVPLEHLMVETDAPYLSPEPVRKVRPNEPCHVVHTVECLARVRGLAVREIAEHTTANACALFSLTNAH